MVIRNIYKFVAASLPLAVKSTINHLIHRALVLIALLVVLLLRCMSRILVIRFAPIVNNRIGALTIDSSYFFANQPETENIPVTLNWFYFDGPSCNQYWSDMVQKNLFVRPWVKYLYRASKKLQNHDRFAVPTLRRGRDPEGFFRNPKRLFEIPKSDNMRAEHWMNEFGWKKDEPIACLLVRDSKYLTTQTPTESTSSAVKDWSYHDYRDSDIATFSAAIEFLLNEGYWVVRMGKSANSRSLVQNPRFIDYPFLNNQEDLIDIWLSINCRLFVSTGAGIDIIPTIYRKPSSIFLNANPLGNLHSWHDMTWTPKHLKWRKSGNYLTLREHLTHSYGRQGDYNDAGIQLIDLTSSEILDAVKEHYYRKRGEWHDTPDDIKRQKLFWEILKTDSNYFTNHTWINPAARVGAHYLRKMGDAFFE